MTDQGDATGSFLISEPSIPHKYTIIPSDQQQLLDRPDAWETKGIPNLPPKVLQDVKDAFSLRLEKGAVAEHATPETRRSGRLSGSSRQTQSKRKAEEYSKPVQGPERSDGEDGEDPIPWTPSPTQHKRGPIRPDELPALRPSSIRVPSSSPLSTRPVLSPVVSRKVQKAAAQPPSVRNLKARSAQPAPSSSLPSEPDIEYQPPRAITDVADPVDKVLRSTQPPPAAQRVLRSTQRPAPTPPSAQVTVPCTWKEPSSPEIPREPAEQPQNKRRRVMKAPKFESSQMINAEPTVAASGSRLAPLGLNCSQASSASSISVIGTGSLKQSAQRGRAPSGPKPKPSAVSPSSSQAQVVQPVEEEQSSSSFRLPPNGPASQAPFVAFTAAYPDYTGGLRAFVNAAIYITKLEETHSVPDFLYDDYIRVFAHHYVDYIERYKKERPLSAFQWYNINVRLNLYTKRVFTRENIADILKYYPDIAASGLHKLTQPSSPSVATTRVSSSESEGLPKDNSSHGQLADPDNETRSPNSLPPVPTGRHDVPTTLRPDQIEKVEPLRSVPGYVVTVSRSNSSPSKQGHDQVSVPLQDPEIKEEEDDGPPSTIDASSKRKDNTQDIPHATSDTDAQAPAPTQYATPLQGHVDGIEQAAEDIPRDLSGQEQDELAPQRPKSPTPSFGDVLTQPPPATAASFVSDFTRSVESIPETAVKSKNGPRFSGGLSTGPRWRTVDSLSSKAPPSSAVSATSKRSKRQRLTKQERFAMFLKKRQVQSSAPKSTIED